MAASEASNKLFHVTGLYLYPSKTSENQRFYELNEVKVVLVYLFWIQNTFRMRNINISQPELFYKKMLLWKISQNSQENTSAGPLLLITLLTCNKPVPLWNRDSDKAVFLWILGSFLEQLFYRQKQSFADVLKTRCS